jgi:glycosyltransferase involved in cell wall biosynthesis
VEKELGPYPVRIVGRGLPDDLASRANASIQIAGWLAELRPAYESARVAIAPLRYGAGVKGKIGEALSFGVPMVMTSVGSEGLRLRHDVHALIADDAAAFAKHIVTLVRDDDVWSRLSVEGRRHIDSEFGLERFRADLADALAAVTRP